jgi:hypothetical protein
MIQPRAPHRTRHYGAWGAAVVNPVPERRRALRSARVGSRPYRKINADHRRESVFGFKTADLAAAFQLWADVRHRLDG